MPSIPSNARLRARAPRPIETQFNGAFADAAARRVVWSATPSATQAPADLFDASTRHYAGVLMAMAEHLTTPAVSLGMHVVACARQLPHVAWHWVWLWAHNMLAPAVHLGVAVGLIEAPQNLRQRHAGLSLGYSASTQALCMALSHAQDAAAEVIWHALTVRDEFTKRSGLLRRGPGE